MSSAGPAIEIRSLTKIFRGRRLGWDLLKPWKRPEPTCALAGVDLTLQRGELVSVLGPNGAGKTTMLKILATLVTPTSGSVFVEGVDLVLRPEAARENIGYVLADERSFFWRLTGQENLRFFAALQGLSGREADRRVQEVAALVGVREQLSRDFMVLSAGQKQRMAIARGLLSDPSVLLFDEATRSLDPGRAERLRRVIRKILVEGERKTVLFATHDLEEAREVSDRIVLMARGGIDSEGQYDALEPRIREVFRAESIEEEAELVRLFPGAMA